MRLHRLGAQLEERNVRPRRIRQNLPQHVEIWPGLFSNGPIADVESRRHNYGREHAGTWCLGIRLRQSENSITGRRQRGMKRQVSDRSTRQEHVELNCLLTDAAKPDSQRVAL